MKSTLRIYVSTYAKYNDGSLAGKWLDLPMTKKKLYSELLKIAGSERDAEFMIQDTESSVDFRSVSEYESIEKLNNEVAEIQQEARRAKLSDNIRAALDEYKKVWGNANGRMMDYCESNISDVYKTANGDLIEFEKQRIETDFCFCEDFNGMYNEETEKNAQKMEEHSRTRGYFFSRNMKSFDVLEKALSGDNHGKAYAARMVYSGCDDELKLANLKCAEYFERFRNEIPLRIELSREDVAGLKIMLDAEKEKFKKRLETWWKKYGADGLHTWTYLSD